jgi:diaminopimelate epimerase
LAWGLVPRSVEHVVVHMDGGDARVHISDDRRATLIGPAVFIGNITVHV